MHQKARIQSWLTLAAVLALPLLYFGGIRHLLAVSILGLVVFAGSLLICPALQLTGFGRPASAAKGRARRAETRAAAARR